MKEMIQGVLEPSISHLGFPFLLCFLIQTLGMVNFVPIVDELGLELEKLSRES